MQFKCGKCEYVNNSERGLKQHTRIKHRISQLDGMDENESEEKGTQTDNSTDFVLPWEKFEEDHLPVGC